MPTTGRELLRVANPHRDVWNVAFSPDGTRLATGDGKGTADVWDAATGAELFMPAAHSAMMSSVAFSPDGSRLATASYDGTIKVWGLTNGAGQELLSLKDDDAIASVTFSPECASPSEGCGSRFGPQPAMRASIM